MTMQLRFRLTMLALPALAMWVVASSGPARAARPVSAALTGSLAFGQQSSLDLPEEAEEPPLNAPPKSSSPPSEEKPGSSAPKGSLDEEEAPLTPPKESSGTVVPLDDLGSEEPSDGEEPEEPVCDIVVAPTSEAGGTRRARPVKLLNEFLKVPLPPNSVFEFHVLNSTGKGSRTLRTPGNTVERVEYYEERMLKKAADAFKVTTIQLSRPGAEFDLNDQERQQLAPEVEKILKRALAEHDSAVQRFLRPRKDWTTNLRRPLAQALLNIQAHQIRLMMKKNATDEALAACDQIRSQLSGGGMGQLDLRPLYDEILLGPALIDAYQGSDYEETHRLLKEFSVRFPSTPSDRANRIRERLIQDAQNLAARAAAEGDIRERVRLLEAAGRIWPQLMGLDDELRQVQADYPVLEIAYSSLPKNFSPLNVSAPVERHAAALVFESLVQWTEHSPAGPHYATQLAAARPAPLAKGRRFRLPQCEWSDTQPNELHLCTAEDVRRTLEVYKKVNPAGFSPAWERLIQGVQSSDAFSVSIRVNVDHWQPLSLMDFMILPNRYFADGGTQAELNAFNANPVGTGPYRRLADNDQKRVRFQANPYYRKAKDGLPKIREISFNRMEPIEAADEFRNGKIHMIVGVPREQVVQLEQQGHKVVPLPARSVYFLAPNYRKTSSILRLPEVRKAIAHAIDRKQILEQVFRPGQHNDRCFELNGPYPVGSWAYNKDAPKFDRALAKVQLRDVKDQVAASPPLRLVHPERDPDAVRACQEIAKQVQAELGIELTLEGVEPENFYRQVVEDHNFDLVYWRHDYDDETYWIWPLFDPDDAEGGGANFMGIKPEEALRVVLFDTVKQHKEFSRIRTLAHQAHAEIARGAAIIPLWQLSTHVAVSRNLRDAQSRQLDRFDPVYLFEDVESWSLRTGGGASR